MLFIVKCVLFYVTICAAGDVPNEELHRLPKLFHLDDYDRCLSQKDGLYCVGTFQLSPKEEPNPAYDIILEQNKQLFSFDRKLLHRGYCLSKRCLSSEKNTTLRFEQCADRILRKLALSARLQKLSYCKTYADRKAKLAEKPDLPQRMFLSAVYCILFLNVLGTLHDVFGDGKKHRLLMAWSIPANWRSLTAVDDGIPTFAPIQSSKIILHCIIIYTHSNLIHYMSYVHNPEDMEKSRYSFVNVVIRNGTSLVQVFILISSFFTGYNVLVTAQHSAVTAGLAVRWILKRLFRLAPVYLLLTAFAATWWPRLGDGPLWTPLVEAESQICRNKFWTHLLFVNNFVDASELCMVQSWAMAAEVQLFFVSLLLTLLLIRLRVGAVPILAALFAASCLFNVTLAYTAGLVPMVKIIVPEKLRVEFRGSNSFFHLHISPWSNLPACFFGLLVAHLYFEQKKKKEATREGPKISGANGAVQNGLSHENAKMGNGNGVSNKENGINDYSNGIHGKTNGVDIRDNGVHNQNGLIHRKVTQESKSNGIISSGENINGKEKSNEVINGNVATMSSDVNGNQKELTSENKQKDSKKKAHFLLRYAHCFTFPTLIWWVVAGSRIEDVDSKLTIALYVGLERLMFSLTFACQLLQVITVKGPWATLMSWRGWSVPARLVLSVAMVHWCVNLTMVAARPLPLASSLLHVSIDCLATLFYSYVIALPVCLLVELPTKKFIDALIS